MRAKADAFVTAANRHANFGGIGALRVDASPATRTYLMFRLNLQDREVRHASLLLWSRGRSRAGYQVRLAGGRWKERRINYSNAPRPADRFVASGRVRGGAWKAVNVTSLVDADQTSVSFAITTTSRDGGEFSSRESGLHGPRLVVETQERETTSTETDNGAVSAQPANSGP